MQVLRIVGEEARKSLAIATALARSRRGHVDMQFKSAERQRRSRERLAAVGGGRIAVITAVCCVTAACACCVLGPV